MTSIKVSQSLFIDVLDSSRGSKTNIANVYDIQLYEAAMIANDYLSLTDVYIMM